MSRGRDLAGWLGAGMASAGLFAGAAVAAFRMPDVPLGTAPVEAVALDLSVGVVAMAEAVPSVPPAVPQTVHTRAPESPVAEAAPLTAAAEPAPQIDLPQPMTLPVVEAAPVVAAPPPPERMEEPLDLVESPRPRTRSSLDLHDARAEDAEAERVEQLVAKAPPEGQAEPAPPETAAAQAAGAQQAAQPAQKRREAGGREAARYGDLVMRQIAKQRRAKAPDRGVVTVGFEVGADGGLRRVAIVTSSGSVALDQVAVDHIRRAAPFPPPPQGAATRFAFEFVGK